MQKNFKDMMIGDRLKYAREKAGKTQDYLAKKTKKARNTIGNYENGVTEKIPLHILQAYHRLTGESYDFLLDGKKEEDLELLKKIEKLNHEEKGAIATLIDYYLKNNKNAK